MNEGVALQALRTRRTEIVEDTENLCLSWVPVLKFTLTPTNSNGLALRRPGMQQERRTMPVCLARRVVGRPDSEETKKEKV